MSWIRTSTALRDDINEIISHQILLYKNIIINLVCFRCTNNIAFGHTDGTSGVNDRCQRKF